jgi:hypothetical protein
VINSKILASWEWWYVLVIPALRRMRQEDWEFEAILGYKCSSISWDQEHLRQFSFHTTLVCSFLLVLKLVCSWLFHSSAASASPKLDLENLLNGQYLTFHHPM